MLSINIYMVTNLLQKPSILLMTGGRKSVMGIEDYLPVTLPFQANHGPVSTLAN